MCQWVSYFEINGEILFITKDDMNNSYFKKIVKNNSRWWEDVVGHGFLRKYLGIKAGKEGPHSEINFNEFTDKFIIPEKILHAIRTRKFRGVPNAWSLSLLNKKGVVIFNNKKWDIYSNSTDKIEEKIEISKMFWDLFKTHGYYKWRTK